MAPDVDDGGEDVVEVTVVIEVVLELLSVELVADVVVVAVSSGVGAVVGADAVPTVTVPFGPSTASPGVTVELMLSKPAGGRRPSVHETSLTGHKSPDSQRHSALGVIVSFFDSPKLKNSTSKSMLTNRN